MKEPFQNIRLKYIPKRISQLFKISTAECVKTYLYDKKKNQLKMALIFRLFFSVVKDLNQRQKKWWEYPMLYSEREMGV